MPGGIKTLAENLQNIRNVFEGIAKLAEALPSFEKIGKSIKKATRELPEAAASMSNHGWYFDWTMAVQDSLKLNNMIAEGKVDEADTLLQSYWRRKLPSIESELGQLFPNRARFISMARRCHDDGEYALSIPILLIQADGFCHDVAKASIFRRESKGNDRRLLTATWVDKEAGANEFMKKLLRPFERKTPISFSKMERGEDLHGLYRHMILHGESTDYDTEQNSLKAWSFLYYVGASLKHKDHGVIANASQGIRLSELIEGR